MLCINLCFELYYKESNPTHRPTHRLTHRPTHLISVLVGVASGPEEVSADADGAALVRFLQQFGGSESALGSQRLVVLLAETAHALECANDQRDGSKLGLRVTDLILIQRERLREGDRQGTEGVRRGRRWGNDRAKKERGLRGSETEKQTVIDRQTELKTKEGKMQREGERQ